jgi:DNA modification methylase
MSLRAHEDIAVFCRKGAPYHPQGLVPVEIKNGRKNKAARGVYNQCKGADYVQREGNFPRSIIKGISTDTTNPHPTAKPVALMEYLIRTYTNPGDTVLDNCMGSGTTGVVCVNTGRSFIGVELDKNYFAVAERRIMELL